MPVIAAAPTTFGLIEPLKFFPWKSVAEVAEMLTVPLHTLAVRVALNVRVSPLSSRNPPNEAAPRSSLEVKLALSVASKSAM